METHPSVTGGKPRHLARGNRKQELIVLAAVEREIENTPGRTRAIAARVNSRELRSPNLRSNTTGLAKAAEVG